MLTLQSVVDLVLRATLKSLQTLLSTEELAISLQFFESISKDSFEYHTEGSLLEASHCASTEAANPYLCLHGTQAVISSWNCKFPGYGNQKVRTISLVGKP